MLNILNPIIYYTDDLEYLHHILPTRLQVTEHFFPQIVLMLVA